MATMEQPAKPTLELYKQSFREYLVRGSLPMSLLMCG